MLAVRGETARDSAKPERAGAGRGPIRWLPAAVVLASIFATLLLYYPGALSPDGAAMYRQVVDGDWDTTKPVAMRHLWWLTDRVICGPGGIFLLQVAAYWSGILLITRSLPVGSLARVLLILGIGFFPLLFGHLPHVGTNTQVVAACLCGLGLILEAQRASSRRLILIGLPFLFYAGMVRHESLVGVIPLLYLASSVWIEQFRKPRPTSGPWRRRWLMTIVLALSVASCGQSINRLGSRRVDVWAQLLMWDLSAVSIATGEMLLPASVLVHPERDHNLGRLEEHFSPSGVVPLFWNDEEFAQFNPPSDVNRRLVGTWLSVIAAHPGAYLAHRGRVFLRLFALGGRVPWAPYFREAASEDVTTHCAGPLRRSYEIHSGNAAVSRLLGRLAYTPLYFGWVYLLLGLGVVVVSFAVRHRLAASARIVAASGLAAAAPLAWIVPVIAFRFTLWVVAAASIAWLLLVVAIADVALRSSPQGRGIPPPRPRQGGCH